MEESSIEHWKKQVSELKKFNSFHMAQAHMWRMRCQQLESVISQEICPKCAGPKPPKHPPSASGMMSAGQVPGHLEALLKECIAAIRTLERKLADQERQKIIKERAKRVMVNALKKRTRHGVRITL